MTRQSPFTRTERVLAYIHDNLEQALTLDDLARVCGVSRWQLQRIFQQQTGLNVAQYVRELKLSLAADTVLQSDGRMLDIAYQHGFASEVSFSRAFKQFFGLSPSAYRRRGIRVGLRNPIQIGRSNQIDHAFLQTRIEYREPFAIFGLSTALQGVLAEKPDFYTQVPLTWEKLLSQVAQLDGLEAQMIGVVDTRLTHDSQQHIEYWAGLNVHLDYLAQLKQLQSQSCLSRLAIPAQEYAVVSYQGQLSGFSQLVEWLICEWLPDSGYDSINGFELECYGELALHGHQPSQMEYWLPVIPVTQPRKKL
ncbi:helix-turn-helix domain-containing protein [Shewanella waksmanii]|uniref:helix-turn-helix domain-containing protein n=1 Tax=Shewanella waksmanii TaxID=213783 RepID=UPI003736A3C3